MQKQPNPFNGFLTTNEPNTLVYIQAMCSSWRETNKQTPNGKIVIHTYIHTYTHTHTHTYIYIYIYIYTHTHIKFDIDSYATK